MYIQGILLEHYIASPKDDINSATPSSQCHAVFHCFLSDDSKRYATTTIAHITRLIELHKDKQLLIKYLSTI